MFSEKLDLLHPTATSLIILLCLLNVHVLSTKLMPIESLELTIHLLRSYYYRTSNGTLYKAFTTHVIEFVYQTQLKVKRKHLRETI